MITNSDFGRFQKSTFLLFLDKKKQQNILFLNTFFIAKYCDEVDKLATVTRKKMDTTYSRV